MDELKQQLAEQERKLAFVGKAAPGVARGASRDGAKFLAARMQAAAPMSDGARRVGGKIVKPGGMKRSIGFRGLRAKPNSGGAKAGFDVGKKVKGEERGSHGHLYVEGTDERYTGFHRIRKRGKTVEVVRNKQRNKIEYRGRSPAHKPSFIKTVTTAAEPQMWDVVIESINQRTEKVLKSL